MSIDSAPPPHADFMKKSLKFQGFCRSWEMALRKTVKSTSQLALLDETESQLYWAIIRGLLPRH